jgi:hypothetical protein
LIITRVGKGTASSKTSGTTLTLSSVDVRSGSSIIVCLAYDNENGAPTSVTWGNRELSQLIVRAQSGMSTAIWILRHIHNHRTRTITATWSSAITAKVMAVTEIKRAHILDVSQGNTQTATADPATGTPVTTTYDHTFHIAVFGSRGPGNDTVGTPGVGHASGQRVGTNGAPPISNVTLHETFEELTSTGNCRATKTGATVRDWANVIIAIKHSTKRRQGISPSDFNDVEAIFETANLDMKDCIWKWNRADDRWDAYETTDPGTLRAIGEPGGWVAP